MAVNTIVKLQFLSFIVVRAKSQYYEDSQILGRHNSKTLKRLTKNLVWMITSAITSGMPKFKKIAPLGALRRMHKMSPLRVFSFPTFFFVTPNFA